jgi:ArsR family transcriptional regulator, arsenate/arsenite/antimonite-responsive transcriptional repressor
MFAALSNPNRAVIFLRLASCCCGEAESCNHDEMRTCVGDLGKNLGIAASTVSHHIKELHRAGLIRMERCGRTVKCCVDPRAVQELADFFGTADVETRRPGLTRKGIRAKENARG